MHISFLQITCFDASNDILIVGTERKTLMVTDASNEATLLTLAEIPVQVHIHRCSDTLNWFSLAFKSGKIGSNISARKLQDSPKDNGLEMNTIELFDVFDKEVTITALEFGQDKLFIGTEEGTVSLFQL